MNVKQLGAMCANRILHVLIASEQIVENVIQLPCLVHIVIYASYGFAKIVPFGEDAKGSFVVLAFVLCIKVLTTLSSVSCVAMNTVMTAT